jgi:hypothetical protein
MVDWSWHEEDTARVMGASGPLTQRGAGLVPRRRERVAREAFAIRCGHPVTERLADASWPLNDLRPDFDERHWHAASSAGRHCEVQVAAQPFVGPRPLCEVATSLPVTPVLPAAIASVVATIVILIAPCLAMPCTMGRWAAAAHGWPDSPRVGRASSTCRVRQCLEPGGTTRFVMARARSRREG